MESILSIYARQKVYDPYQADIYTVKDVEGTGFMVENNYFVTTASIAKNSTMSVKNRSREYQTEVVGICIEKNLALCKVKIESKLIFGDNMKLHLGDPVTNLSYNSISSGIIKTFFQGSNYQEDSYMRGPVTYQITNKVDTKDIGGPVLNSRSEVIGIVSSKDGHIIPSRTLLAIYPSLKKGLIEMPTLGFEWCNTNRELMKIYTGTSSTYGIFVKNKYDGTCLDSLERGDIIRRLDYDDPFWDNRDLLKQGKSTRITIFLDRFGKTNKVCKLKDPEEADENKIGFEKIYTDRKMSLSEIVDMIPINSNLMLNICRDKSWYGLKTKYISLPNERIPNSITPYNFLEIGGLCLCDCDTDHKTDSIHKSVIVVDIIPGSNAFTTGSITQKDIIKSILCYDDTFKPIEETNKIVMTIKDIQEVLGIKHKVVQLKMTNGSTFVTM